MNLNSLGSFSSLATSAFDTARSTFKGLAEAAVTPGGTDAPTAGGRPAPAKPVDAAAEAKTEGTAETAKTGGGRLGTLLDAYA